MSFPFRSGLVFLFGASVLLAMAGPAFAGKLAGDKVKPDMKYKLTDCKRPDKPKIKGDSVDEYNRSVAAFEAYSSAQHKFADCVERTVGADMKAVQEAIFTGGQHAIAESQRDIDSLKHELDFYRSQLKQSGQ